MKSFCINLLAMALCLLVSNGAKADWKKSVDDKWEYEILSEKINPNPCQIRPAGSMSGTVTIPRKIGVKGSKKMLQVTKIAERAFERSSGITAFKVEDGHEYFSAKEGVLFDKQGLNLLYYPIAKEGDYTIPEDAINIGDFAFCRCKKLTGVTFLRNPDTIGLYAFSECRGLKAFRMDASVPGSGKYYVEEGVLFASEKGVKTLVAYPGGSSVKQYKVPEGINEIAAGAFYGSRELISVEIPGSVEKIKIYAFLECKKLQKLKLSEGLQIVYNGAFAGCSELTEVTLPNSVTVVQLTSFQGCSKLQKLTLGAGVQIIAKQAFFSCTALQEVTIPAGVKTIGEKAFAGCDLLQAVYWKAGENVKVLADAFGGSSGKSKKLYVELGKKKAFEDKPWVKENRMLVEEVKAFFTVTFDANGGVLPAGMESTLKLAEGEKVAQPSDPTREGYTFVEWRLEGKRFEFGKETITKDVTLVAVWGWTVTFDANGGVLPAGMESTLKLAEGEKVAQPSDPTREGYTFVEWRLEGKRFEFGKETITKDITLVAEWKQNESKPSIPSVDAAESSLLSSARIVANPIGEVLEIEGLEAAVRLVVYSYTGICVVAMDLQGESRVAVCTSGWARGGYVVRILAADGDKVLRGVKE